MRILLAEDDPVTRKILAAELKALGHTIVETEDGDSAWLEFDRQPFQVVISDWRMPGLDGLQLAQKVRERPRTAYAWFILVTSAGDTRENLKKAVAAGIDDLLPKPVDRELLTLRLQVAARVLSLETRVEELQGFLPICAYCKRIRNDKDQYERMETYIEQRSGATFSHTYCPDCIAKHFPARR